MWHYVIYYDLITLITIWIEKNVAKTLTIAMTYSLSST